MYDLVIKNGKVYTGDKVISGDVAVLGGKIARVAGNLSGSSRKNIDAKGCYVMPGGIDVHVHFQLPVSGMVSADTFESGSKAAACGGVTTFLDFSGQGDNDNNLTDGVNRRLREIEGNSYIDYSLHAGITGWKKLSDASSDFRRLQDMGIPTVKMFMIYENRGWLSDDADIYSALTLSRQTGTVVCIHAESEKVMNLLIAKNLNENKALGAYAHALSRPNFIEEEAVCRAVKWAEVTGGSLYIVHLSSGGSLDCIRGAHKKGVRVYTETCPQYLLLNDSLLKDKERGHLYATCPQLKKMKDNKLLWGGVKDGSVVIASTDTCSFRKSQKDMWNGDFTKIPYGLPGVETLLPVLFTYGVKKGRINMDRFVSLVSSNPAKFMGMYPQKGAIKVGSDADITIIDPVKKRRIKAGELATDCDWSPYEGMQVYGLPKCTISRGEVIVDNGEFVGRKGHGRFVKRKPYGWRELGKPWRVKHS